MDEATILACLSSLDQATANGSVGIWLEASARELAAFRSTAIRLASAAHADTIASASKPLNFSQDPQLEVVDRFESALSFYGLAFSLLSGVISSHLFSRAFSSLPASQPAPPAADVRVSASKAQLFVVREEEAVMEEPRSRFFASPLSPPLGSPHTSSPSFSRMSMLSGSPMHGNNGSPRAGKHVRGSGSSPLVSSLMSPKAICRDWNSLLTPTIYAPSHNQAHASRSLAAPVLACLVLLRSAGSKIWSNYDKMADVAREAGMLVPKLTSLYSDGIRLLPRPKPTVQPETTITEASLQGKAEPAASEAIEDAAKSKLVSVHANVKVKERRSSLTFQATIAALPPSTDPPTPTLPPIASPAAQTQGQVPGSLPRMPSKRMSFRRMSSSGPAGMVPNLPRTLSKAASFFGASQPGSAHIVPHSISHAFGFNPSNFSVPSLLTVLDCPTTGTAHFLTSNDPGMGEQIYVLMNATRFSALLRRMWRISMKASIFRRRLVYVLTMDRMDSDGKIQARMLDLLQKLRGAKAPVAAVLFLMKSMGVANRKALFER
jgi:hypothetical protein